MNNTELFNLPDIPRPLCLLSMGTPRRIKRKEQDLSQVDNRYERSRSEPLPSEQLCVPHCRPHGCSCLPLLGRNVVAQGQTSASQAAGFLLWPSVSRAQQPRSGSEVNSNQVPELTPPQESGPSLGAGRGGGGQKSNV